MAANVVGKTKYLSFVLLAVILIIVGYYLSQNKPAQPALTQPLPTINERPADIATSPEIVDANAALEQAKHAMGESAPSPAGDQIEHTGNSQPSTPAWKISHDNPTSMPLPDGVVAYEPVAVDMESPAYPEPGQQISLGLPGGETVSATVRSSNENPNGDYSWRGYLDGHGTDYPVVMTYGAKSVFATITTPKGSYTLESINGSGWVYKNPSEFELSEPGKNDYLEIPHSHHHE